MIKDIFIDTSFVIALINKKDLYHDKALELSIKYENYPLITTEAVLLEIGNALAMKFKKEAIKIIEAFNTSDTVRIVEYNIAIFEKAFEIYKGYSDKTWGIVDCISFIVMKENSIVNALTSDNHFKQAGFKALMKNDNFV